MPRFDSYRSSTWNDGAALTGAQVDGTTLVSVTIPAPGFYLLAVAGCCDLPWNYNLIHYAADGTTVRHQQKRVLAAGTEDWIFPAPFECNAGDQFVIKLVGAVSPTVALQMSLFPTLLG
jgi:hypothetical protein